MRRILLINLITQAASLTLTTLFLTYLDFFDEECEKTNPMFAEDILRVDITGCPTPSEAPILLGTSAITFVCTWWRVHWRRK